VGNFLAGRMTVVRVYNLSTIGWGGEIVTLKADLACPTVHPLLEPVWNLVCSIAKIKTAFQLLGVLLPCFVGFINNMHREASMIKTQILNTHIVTICFTINFKRLDGK